MVDDGVWWWMMVDDGGRWWMMVDDGGWWWMMVDDGGWWWMMVDDGGRWWMMVDDGGWWWMMVDDGGRWWMMVDDGGWWWMMVDDGGWWWMMVDDGGWWRVMVDDGGWWWVMVGDVECDAENDELSWKQLKMGETLERELVETIWTLFGCFWKKTSFDCSILFQPLMAWCGNPLRWAPACCVASKVGYAAAMYCWSALRRVPESPPSWL